MAEIRLKALLENVTGPVVPAAPIYTGAQALTIANGAGFSVPLTASGTGPIAYSLIDAPAGVAIVGDNMVGTAIVRPSSTWQIVATSAVLPADTKSFALTVSPPVVSSGSFVNQRQHILDNAFAAAIQAATTQTAEGVAVLAALAAPVTAEVCAGTTMLASLTLNAFTVDSNSPKKVVPGQITARFFLATGQPDNIIFKSGGVAKLQIAAVSSAPISATSIEFFGASTTYPNGLFIDTSASKGA